MIDDGYTYKGHAEVRNLLVDTTGVKAVFAPGTVRQENGQLLVEGPVHGDFKGSPIHFTYRFTLANEAITALEITL